MDIVNMIRAFIFFIPGLALLFFPSKVYLFQSYLLRMFRIKYDIERDRKYYFYFGMSLIVISIILFVFSILN